MWQYVREDALLAVIDGFFEQHVFGQQRIARFLEQRAALAGELRSEGHEERTRVERRLTDVDQRVELQLRAIEAGTDPTLVRDRVEALKAERDELQAALAAFDDADRADTAIDLDDACEILDSLPNLTEALAAADPELRRRVFDAFRLAVALDRNAGQIRVKALISSALTKTRDLRNLVANRSIAGQDLNLRPPGYETCVARSCNARSRLPASPQIA
jgi:site-specific DNA recombinase